MKEMKNAGRLYSDMVEKIARCGKRKSAHLVLQRDAKSYRADPHSQAGSLSPSDRGKVKALMTLKGRSPRTRRSTI